MELTEEQIKRSYQALLRQRERAKRNYKKNREAILIKRKEYREKQLEGQQRNPVGRRKKSSSNYPDVSLTYSEFQDVV